MSWRLPLPAVTVTGAVAVLSFVLVLCLPAGAVDFGSDSTSEELYLLYCGACHGKSGTGDGPLAEALVVKPADLTQFSKNNGGVFPYLQVFRAVDGRKRVRGHGEAAMPVWGQVLAAEPGKPLGEQMEAAGKLLLITTHVEALQERDESAER